VLLTLSRDEPASEPYFLSFEKERLLARLKALDARAQRHGLQSLDPARNRLISIGMEIDARGRVTKNGYGVFHLSWAVSHHPEWAEMVEAELEEVRRRIRETHQSPLRFLIWAGMGGSAEDKAMYLATGLLRRSPGCFLLDSTDPVKLQGILDELLRRSRLTLADALRGTLVVGMAMGMTSWEPVVNLERLASLYDRHRLDSRPNFLYMTLPGSLLDRFAAARGYRKVELQPDGGNSTAGRHSGPLTRGSLYPLGLNGCDLRAWMEATLLTDANVSTAWRLAAFLHAQGKAGRDKVTLLPPKPWTGAARWTKQDFEESLGKSEELGIKIVIDEKTKLANYRRPGDARQDRLFLVIQLRGAAGPDPGKLAALRRAGYPVACLTFPRGTPLSGYMQFMHYVVFGLGWLREMNFVTQPSVELYKSIAGQVFAEAQKAGGFAHSPEWKRLKNSSRQASFRVSLTLCWDPIELPESGGSREADAPAIYARLLGKLAAGRQAEYAELTFFGDTRYSARGQAVRRLLGRAGEAVFGSRLKMPVDVYEGPAMNHSYHEMIIGHGKCFSTILLAEKQARLATAQGTADYHVAQFLATRRALLERGRPVVAILLKDLEESTIAALDGFFLQVRAHLRADGN